MLTVFCSLVPSAINLFLSYSHSTAALQRQYINSSQAMLDLVGRDMDTYYGEMISKMNFPYSNAPFLTAVNDPAGKEAYESRKLIEETMAAAAFNNPDIEAVSFYIQRWDSLFMEYPKGSFRMTMQAPGAELTGDLTGAASAGYNEVFWETTSPIKQLMQTRNAPQPDSPLTVKRYFYNNFRYLGVFYFDIKNESIIKFARSLRSEPDEFIIVLDAEGFPVYSTKRDWGPEELAALADAVFPRSGSGTLSEFGGGAQRNLVLFRKLENYPWTIVKGIPYKALEESSRTLVWLNVIVQIGFTVAAVLLAVLLSILLYRPLLRLVRGINKVNQGHLGFTVTPSGGAEMVKTINSFNEMSRNLQQVVEVEYRSRLHMHRAQLKALQAQINPHFLYNAFQVIGSMALERGAEEINEITCALAKLCRYSISPSDDLVGLGVEIEHVRHFLEIQQLRFRDKLAFRIDCPPELGETPLPKLTLLPIVENAFIHGLKNVKHAEISVVCRQEGDSATIRIRDNGTGIAPERLEQIRQWFRQSHGSMFDLERIGLTNVQERLLQHFGPDAELRFETAPGAGTTVLFSLPIGKEAPPA